MKRRMFYKASPMIFENARELRSNQTHAEKTFWLLLKEKFPDYKFRRQHPISTYIADFYCHKLKLVIEIDGSIHNLIAVKLKDEKRQNYLENLTLTVIRFTNEQIKNEVEKVLNIISSTIEKLISKKES